MDYSNAIRARRSIRKYQKDVTVTREQLQKLLEAAMLAPSAGNSRPWEFVVVTNREKLNQLAQAHPYAKMLLDAPLAIIVCGLPESQKGMLRDFFPQDCAAATQNILIEAAALGLGSCWCGVYPRTDRGEEISAIFDLPPNLTPFNIIAIGMADESPDARGFYDQEKVRMFE